MIMLLDVLMISSQVQGPGPLQSMKLVQLSKVLDNYKSCLRQEVGEIAECDEVVCLMGNNP